MAADEAGLTIAQMSEATGVTAHTLRYYERVGLVDPERDDNDRRRYRRADLDRIVFVTRMRQSEMPIRDLVRYVALVEQGPATEPERLRMLQAHRIAVERRLGELHDALFVVDYKIAVYGGATGDPERTAPSAACDLPSTKASPS